MNQVKIKSLSLLNFKGIRKLEITNFGQDNYIFGDNATGKTSVFDAFTWLLFGKDSSDRTAFEIKTLDSYNQPIPKLDHEVGAVLEINGEETEVRRVLREKWVTRRGSSEAEFSGNETLYFWNEVPVSAKEFSNKIGQVLDEKIFKMITNPLAFNSMKWQDRRTVLIDMVGGVSDKDIAEGNEDYQRLLGKLTNKSLEEYQKQVAASLRKMKAELKTIPTRIDEVERGKPQALNFSQIKAELEEAGKELQSIDAQINDKLESDQVVMEHSRTVRSQIHKLEDQIAEIERKAHIEARRQFHENHSEEETLHSKLRTIKDETASAKRTFESLSTQKEVKLHEIKTLKEQNEELKETWAKVNAEKFEMDEDSCKCPTCKREFEAEDIEAKRSEMEANFNKDKRQRLEAINNKGQANSVTAKALEKEAEDLQERLDKGLKVIEGFKEKEEGINQRLAQVDTSDKPSEQQIFDKLIAENKEIPALREEIAKLKEEEKSIKPADTNELKAKKQEVIGKIRNLQDQLSIEDRIKAADKRIAELEKEERAMSQEIANDEREQFVIENFIKAKIETLEKRINAKFEMVSFKMFATQINGGEVETCETLIDGVPFSDANTASKINAGIDIINTLTDYYKVNAPIFIDNRESVVKLVDSRSQIINLVVKEDEKQLRVETDVKEAEFATA